MNPRALLPGSDGRLSTVDRRPGESLYDYLVRCQWEMGSRIRLLEMVRDGQETIFFDERARWRRHMILLAVGEAGFAVAAYILLSACGAPSHGAAPLMAGMIGLGALLGAFASIRILSMRVRLASWLRAIGRLVRRLLCWLVPGDDASAARRALLEAAAQGPQRLEVVIEQRVADCLEVETFLWRLRMLVVQIAIIVTLFSYVQLTGGASLASLVEDAALVAIVCLICGGLFVLAADFLNINLARLARWWGRR